MNLALGIMLAFIAFIAGGVTALLVDTLDEADRNLAPLDDDLDIPEWVQPR